MASVLKESVPVLLAGEESTVKHHFLSAKSSARDMELFFWTLEFAAVIPSGQDLTVLQVHWVYLSLSSIRKV